MNSLEMVFYKDAAANGMTVWQYCLHLNPLSKLRYFLRIYGRGVFPLFLYSAILPPTGACFLHILRLH